jgi:hypothetical protein
MIYYHWFFQTFFLPIYRYSTGDSWIGEKYSNFFFTSSDIIQNKNNKILAPIQEKKKKIGFGRVFKTHVNSDNSANITKDKKIPYFKQMAGQLICGFLTKEK